MIFCFCIFCNAGHRHVCFADYTLLRSSCLWLLVVPTNINMKNHPCTSKLAQGFIFSCFCIFCNAGHRPVCFADYTLLRSSCLWLLVVPTNINMKNHPCTSKLAQGFIFSCFCIFCNAGHRPVCFADYTLLRSSCLWLLVVPTNINMKNHPCTSKLAQGQFFILLLLQNFYIILYFSTV